MLPTTPTPIESTINVILFIGGTILTIGIGMVLAFIFKGLPGRVTALEQKYGEISGKITAIDAHLVDSNRRMGNIENGQNRILELLLQLPKRRTDS